MHAQRGCACGRHVAPAAAAIQGRDNAQNWLVPLWSKLARRSESLPWDAAHADDPAALLMLVAGDCTHAVRAADRLAVKSMAAPESQAQNRPVTA